MDKHTVAVMSDIHSNHRAFKACYEDALRHGADRFVFLGDYVSDLAQTRETLDLLYEIRDRYPTVCLRGNRERYMLECEQGSVSFRPGSKSGSLLYTFEQLRPEDLAFFGALGCFDTIRIGGMSVEVAHAFKEDDRLCFEKGDALIGQVFDGMETRLLLTGHSHRQYVARREGKTIVNPGSVGVPQDGSWLSAYALLWAEDGQFTVRLRQVPYDIRAVIHAQFASGLVERSHCWGISSLYDMICGREGTLRLLEAVSRHGDVYDETVWRREAERMGMAFAEEEVMEVAGKICSGTTYVTENEAAYITGHRGAG